MAKYEDVTIANIEKVIKTGYIDEIVCVGDIKTITIPEEAQLKVKIEADFKPVIDAIVDVGKAIYNMLRELAEILVTTAKGINNKKLTKKKFMKLLQSQGIQRNEINKIVENNKNPYTYLRYHNTIEEYRRNKSN